MNIHYFQHVPFEGLGCIATWAEKNSFPIMVTQFFNADPLPHLTEIDWLIVMGGPMSVHDETIYPWLIAEKRFIQQAIESGKKVLGICLGAQLIAEVLGARVYPNLYKEIGWFTVERVADSVKSPFPELLPVRAEAFHWHGETFDLPAGAIHLARSQACENQAFIYGKNVVGLQFHLEMTRQGAENLLTHCHEDIASGGLYVQTAEALLNHEQRFATSNNVMTTFLDQLVT